MTTFDSAMKAKIPEDILATIRMVVVDRLKMMIKNTMNQNGYRGCNGHGDVMMMLEANFIQCFQCVRSK